MSGRRSALRIGGLFRSLCLSVVCRVVCCGQTVPDIGLWYVQVVGRLCEAVVVSCIVFLVRIVALNVIAFRTINNTCSTPACQLNFACSCRQASSCLFQMSMLESVSDPVILSLSRCFRWPLLWPNTLPTFLRLSDFCMVIFNLFSSELSTTHAITLCISFLYGAFAALVPQLLCYAGPAAWSTRINWAAAVSTRCLVRPDELTPNLLRCDIPSTCLQT